MRLSATGHNPSPFDSPDHRGDHNPPVPVVPAVDAALPPAVVLDVDDLVREHRHAEGPLTARAGAVAQEDFVRRPGDDTDRVAPGDAGRVVAVDGNVMADQHRRDDGQQRGHCPSVQVGLDHQVLVVTLGHGQLRPVRKRDLELDLVRRRANGIGG